MCSTEDQNTQSSKRLDRPQGPSPMHLGAFYFDTLYDGNRLSDGLACKLAFPPHVLTGKNQTGMAASFDLHELSMTQSNALSWAMEI